MNIKERFNKVIEYFSRNMPVAETELKYNNTYELLVSVILSAQCTDKRVNLITPSLFKKFPTIKTLANAEYADVYEFIKSCSYPKNKAKHLVEMARTLIKNFNSIIPSDINDLQKIPGVGRKTANVIASVIYNKPTMAVDTHVFRVSARLGLTANAKTPFQCEQQLVKYIPEEKIPIAHHWLILHGRYVCKARKPNCSECGISKLCKHFSITTSSKTL